MRPHRWHDLLALLAVSSVLALTACAGKKTDYKILRHSSYDYPYPEPLRLYLMPDRDRSGSDYLAKVGSWELPTFRERFSEGLRSRRLRVDTFTSAGNPTTIKLRNPYLVVADSNEADLLLAIRVDAFEEANVDVTADRVVYWTSFGILHSYYTGYTRVPRMLVAIDAQLRERGQASPFYGFQAQGVAVNRATRREGFAVAMQRCEIRFYERLLRQ